MSMTNRRRPLRKELPNIPRSHEKGEKVHHVGPLSYYMKGLIVLFAWMLWGFCYTLMETVVPSILPSNSSLGTSNTAMALTHDHAAGHPNVTSAVGQLLSDRYAVVGEAHPFYH